MLGDPAVPDSDGVEAKSLGGRALSDAVSSWATTRRVLQRAWALETLILVATRLLQEATGGALETAEFLFAKHKTSI